MSTPRIKKLKWGEIKIEWKQRTHIFKDCKLGPNTVEAWDWGVTGTKHIPGIQIEDVKALLTDEVRAVVLSLGQNSRLQVCQETLDWLAEQEGVTVHTHPTPKAVEVYNSLVNKNVSVVGLFHSTC